MVSADCEKPIPLEQAGSLVPGGVARSTLWRWKDEGYKGIRLSTIKVGHKRMVYPSAIAAFVQATTDASEAISPELPAPMPFRSEKQRRAAARQARSRLIRLGLCPRAKKEPPEEVSTGGSDDPQMQGAQRSISNGKI